MERQSSDKVDISRIMLYSTGGPGSTARVSSMEAANSVLQNWAYKQDAQPAECEVEIVFEDGLRYCSHYQLNEQEKGVSLSRHVRRQLAAMTKRQRAKRVTPPTNDSIICPDKRDTIECAKAMLAHYNI